MKRPILIALAILLLTVGVAGQTPDSLRMGKPNAFLSGTVYDINGAVIFGARVVAYSLDGKELDSHTDDEGVYRIQLPADVYTVVATAPGFCLKRLSHFRIVSATSGRMSLDMVLEVAEGSKPCATEGMPARKSEKKSPKRPRAIAE